jgi:hypothetical protein
MSFSFFPPLDLIYHILINFTIRLDKIISTFNSGVAGDRIRNASGSAFFVRTTTGDGAVLLRDADGLFGADFSDIYAKYQTVFGGGSIASTQRLIISLSLKQFCARNIE